ncbi:hypothetical protein J7413_03420 [Shimia sp. R10_1]|uniref:TadE/TadG family type IV pilus assembly protein n=1 Tax=Shimia sp. R10_1 TaxID=2821095 RepID=UPI001ADCCC3E|nr:hypothetical protein [Shimia sp. R10_1]MBO9472578.1 hypothetical protein [Shimia sp. R10_1]
MLIQPFKSIIRRFRNDTRGSVSVEAAIMFPGLFFALIATAIMFDVYRARSTTEKAAFAISDMLARETAAVDQDYIDGMHKLFGEISTLRSEHDLVVSLVSWDLNTNDYRLEWSHAAGGISGHTSASLPDLADKLPTLVPGESLIVVQSLSVYDPPVKILKSWWGDWGQHQWTGLNMNTFVFTRPRFVSTLAWADT